MIKNYPNISRILSAENIPGDLDFLENSIEKALDKIFFEEK